MGVDQNHLSSIKTEWVSRNAGRFGWVILCVCFLMLLVVSPLTSRWVDFPVYWDAGRKALQSQTVYDVAGHFQYKYSPLVALLFGEIFSVFSFGTASWIFQKSMLILWAVLFWNFSGKRAGVVVGLLLFFGNALRLDLALGQINALVVFILALLFRWMETEKNEEERTQAWLRDLAFGVLFSLAVQLKLFCLILVPVLFLRKRWGALIAGLLLIPILSVGGVALHSGWSFALEENVAWMRSLASSTDELLLNEQNVTLLGTFGKIFGPTVAKWIWGVSGAAFLVYLARNRDRSMTWLRNRVLAAIVFLNPLVWSYWILFLMPLTVEAGDGFFRSWIHSKNIKTRTIPILGAIFVLAAFASQHARWAWNGGIFVAMILVGAAVFVGSVARR